MNQKNIPASRKNIKEKTPVKPVKAKGIGMGYGILPREQGIAMRLIKATKKK